MHQNTIGATESTLQRLPPPEPSIPLNVFPNPSKCQKPPPPTQLSLPQKARIAKPVPSQALCATGLCTTHCLRQLADIFDTTVNKSNSNRATHNTSPRVPPQPSPSVDKPSPRVDSTIYRSPHRYPTQQSQQPTLPQTAYHVATVDTTKHKALHKPAPAPHMPKHFANAIMDPRTGKSLEYCHLIQDEYTKKKWTHAFANELGRFAQGVADRHKGTNSIFFIPQASVTKDRKVTYGHIVLAIRPQKKEVERMRLTVGGNLINFPGEVSTRTAGLTKAKILFNSVISTEGAKFMGIDLKNFYLNTPMD
jgi:hypothetical protein